jgi:hypothetical protein
MDQSLADWLTADGGRGWAWRRVKRRIPNKDLAVMACAYAGRY